jgi:capsular polysaccharide export protein
MVALKQLEPRDGSAASDPVEPAPAARERRFLFVSGPFGPFSARLAGRLRAEGARCDRVLLNGGDLFDWGLLHARPYFGDSNGFAGWLRATVQRTGVTDLILFGDCHPYCADARALASGLGLRTHVLELGYFRPHWITLERDGVNANSSLPRSPEAVHAAARTMPDEAPATLRPFGVTVVVRNVVYHLFSYLGWPIFPLYRFPYSHSVVMQMVGHVRGLLAHSLLRGHRKRQLTRLVDTPGPLFLALLQRPGDSQLLRHSPFPTVAAFIEGLVASFARRAPAHARLLFKAHPLDHGLERCDAAVARAAAMEGVADRVFFTGSGDLNRLLDRSHGVITVNSTAGLAAIARDRPTITLGAAIYDMPGLTHQNGLDTFWTRPENPEPRLYQAFRRMVMARTQVNGAFESRQGADLAMPELVRRMLSA